MVVATLVLLIACANIANLLLARATNRRIELSVRRALGAGRWRLVRQCLAESGVLAAAGAVAGVVIAFWASRVLVQQLARESALTVGLTMYGSSRLSLDVSFDWRVLALTMIATVATGLLFGIAPALRASAADPIDAIKAGAATATRAAPSALGRLGGLRLSAMQGLIVTQVALSLALLVTAGLFLRTIASLANIPAGFDVDRVLVVDVDTTRAGGDTQRMSTSERVAAAARTLPGVASVSLSVGAPPISWGVRDVIAIAGIPPAPDPSAAVVLVSPEWFRVFGMPVLAGREFTERDRRGSPPVAIVNTAFVQRLLGGAAPLGRTIVSFEAPIEIVGIVGNIVSDPRGEPQPVMFIPLAQADGRLAGVLDFTLASYGLTMAVRAADRPDVLIPHIAARVGQAEPRASLTFRSPSDQIAALMVRERVLAVLSGFFGVLALLLSALGLYGVAAYAVARQRKEMAVRLALGAGAPRIIGLVLGRVLLPVAAGVSLGVALTLSAAPFIAALLFGVEAHDLTTLGEAALILLAVATFAAWLPTLHAARIDPAVVLRYE
jgi:predicted permease